MTQTTTEADIAQNPMLNAVPSIYDLKLHEIHEVHQPPYYRIMRVPSGWLYNFYDAFADDYMSVWTFVPFDKCSGGY